MTPLVTIAVPTLRRLPYLKEAVASALAQDYPRVEVLIGDDGDDAALGGWCRALAGRDPRVRYQRNPLRLGLAGNWNALADAARGELLAVIGDDDRLLPGFARTLAAALRPPFAVAFSNHYLIDERGRRLASESVRVTRQYGRHLIPAGEVADAAAAVWRNSVPMSAALLRTRDVRRLRFKEDLNTPEIELFVRLAGEGARFVFVPEYLSEYRSHPHSATSAGLLSDRLAERLLQISVAPEVEGHKRRFMAPLLVNAVSRCLQDGRTEAARAFLESEYYPRPRGPRRLLTKAAVSYFVQGACAALPACVGRPVYRLVRRVKAGARL